MTSKIREIRVCVFDNITTAVIGFCFSYYYCYVSLLVYIITMVIVITIITNGNRTEWSTIEGVIGRVISN